MQIFVEFPEGKVITVEVDSSDSIFHVKEKVRDKEGIAIDEQLLYFNDQLLSDSDVLATYEFKNNDKLCLKFHSMVIPPFESPQIKEMNFLKVLIYAKDELQPVNHCRSKPFTRIFRKYNPCTQM